ncbi:hypothetical protein E4U21_001449 [Claviceps maximensis]|nr:hypothetical protein E4U21_001449 [Claviceps maximensis]
MQFSTSAAVAAIAFCAGQSLAACTEYNFPISTQNLEQCTSPASPNEGPNSWRCGTSGVLVSRIGGNEFIMSSKNDGAMVIISCPGKNQVYQCDPNSYKIAQLPCKSSVTISAVY